MVTADDRLMTPAGEGSWHMEVPEPRILDEFRAGMDDDFNTERGLATLFDTVRALNRCLDAEEWAIAAASRAALAAIGQVLGIALQDPRTVLERAKAEHLEESELSAAQIEQLIADRAAARKSRDFQRADEIRAELKAKGVILEDSAQVTTWKVER